MRSTVKGATKIGIDDRVARLRLQLVASDLTRRIGRRIRDRRVELGLTQKQVAQRMATPDLDKQRISDWERAYNQPSQRYLQELVAALEVPDVTYFYAADERPDETPDLSGSHDVQTQLATLMRMVGELSAQLQDIQAAQGEAAATASEAIRLLDDRLPPSRETRRQQPA